MKTRSPIKIRKTLSKIFLGVAAIVAILSAPRASAVPVNFSGGSGTPLSFTLPEPVTYVATSTDPFAPHFVFQNLGNLFVFTTGLIGDITYTINLGPPQTINAVNPVGVSQNDITTNDVFFFDQFMTLPGVSLGDAIVLSAGTLTTTSPIAAAAPSNGMFNTFIIDSVGNKISTFGTVTASVPDSMSTLWLVLPLAGMLAVAHLRRFAARFKPA